MFSRLWCFFGFHNWRVGYSIHWDENFTYCHNCRKELDAK